MPAKKSAQTIRHEETVRELAAYQEAFYCLRKRLPVHVLTSGEESVEYVGEARCSGGVVIVGSTATYAADWCSRALSEVVRNGNPYMADIANQIHRLQEKAIRAA